MQTEMYAIDSLVFDDKNARLHDDRNIEAIKDSLRAFGQQKPIVIDANKRVVAGNGTLKAARDMGWVQLECVTTDLDSLQAAAYAIADNRATDLSDWDDKQVLETMELVRQEMGDDGISAAGFTDKELDKLLAGISVELDQPSKIDNGFTRTVEEYESASIRTITFHYTLPQYEAIVKAFSALMTEYAVHSHSEAVTGLLTEKGYEIPDPLPEED